MAAVAGFLGTVCPMRKPLTLATAGVLVLGAALLASPALASSPTAVSLSHGRLTALTAAPAGIQSGQLGYTIVSPSVSPDGLKVAYVLLRTKNSSGDLHVLEVASGVDKVVSSSSSGVVGTGWVGEPAWSPDSSKLAFTSSAANLGFPRALGIRGVYVKDLSTGQLSLASADPAGPDPNLWCASPAFTPTGNEVDMRCLGGDGLHGLVGKDLLSGAFIPLGYDPVDLSFRWAPQGRFAAVSSVYLNCYQNGRVPVAVFDRVTLELRKVADCGAWATISPDGLRIAWVAPVDVSGHDPEGHGHVFVMDLAGGPARDVTASLGKTPPGFKWENRAKDIKALAWAPDSRHLAYVRVVRSPSSRFPSETFPTDEIIVQDLATNSGTVASTDSSGRPLPVGPFESSMSTFYLHTDITGAWFPDSTRLVFVSDAPLPGLGKKPRSVLYSKALT